MNEALEAITAETDSLLSGIVEGDKVCNNLFASLEESKEELESNKTGLDDC